MIDQLSVDCYILGQYMSIRHNLLYRTWTDRPGVYRDTLYLKFRKKKNERKKN
jgi:hypothetical protein